MDIEENQEEEGGGRIAKWAEDTLTWGMDKSYASKVINSMTAWLFNWAMRNSLYPLHFGIACCALENPAAVADPRYDSERFGVLYRSSPRQCDVLLITGTITKKLRPRLRRLYDQMPEPKWVVAIGSCAISGGPFYEGYHVVPGADEFLPVDIYIPGCPPRPEAFLAGVLKLQKKIKREKKGMFRTRGTLGGEE